MDRGWLASQRVSVLKSLTLTLILVSTLSCSSLISPFNETAYRFATDLKVESLALMDKATESFGNHRQEVEELKIKLRKAHEYAKARPKNEISEKQWRILLDPQRNLLGGFFARWERDSTLSQVFVDEIKGVVSDAFDTISSLESGKIKPADAEEAQ